MQPKIVIPEHIDADTRRRLEENEARLAAVNKILVEGPAEKKPMQHMPRPETPSEITKEDAEAIRRTGGSRKMSVDKPVDWWSRSRDE